MEEDILNSSNGLLVVSNAMLKVKRKKVTFFAFPIEIWIAI